MRFFVYILVLAVTASYGLEIASGKEFDSTRMEVLTYIGAVLGGIFLALVLVFEIGLLWERIRISRKK